MAVRKRVHIQKKEDGDVQSLLPITTLVRCTLRMTLSVLGCHINRQCEQRYNDDIVTYVLYVSNKKDHQKYSELAIQTGRDLTTYI